MLLLSRYRPDIMIEMILGPHSTAAATINQ